MKNDRNSGNFEMKDFSEGYQRNDNRYSNHSSTTTTKKYLNKHYTVGAVNPSNILYTKMKSMHILGIVRITLKDVTGLFYLNYSKYFPQVQHLFPRNIRGTRLRIFAKNIHQYISVFAELRFGNRRLRVNAATNKRNKSNHAWKFANRTGAGGDYVLTDIVHLNKKKTCWQKG